ncbi:MAG: hypothetical protein ACE5IH_10225, partial [Thermodesulfobacteriota bacterium]
TNQLITDILYKLDALNLTTEETEEINKAKKYIERVRDRTINTPKDIEKNIKDILRAIEAVMEITSKDTQDVRLDMDRLMGIWGERGYLGE